VLEDRLNGWIHRLQAGSSRSDSRE
jgi:hypothetical protein